MIERYFEEKYIHRIFVIFLILKGILALIEVIGGIVIFFIPQSAIIDYVQKVSACEFVTDHSGDSITNYFSRWAGEFSVSSLNFAVFYLLSHGLIKLWLIAGLLKNKLWYYPASMAIFSFFALYQFYRYTYTHSITLIFITILDILVLGLIWHEYRYLRSRQKL